MADKLEDGRGSVHLSLRFYSEEMGAGSTERLALAASLRRALENREFDVHYQARRDMESGRVTYVEALLPWHWPC